METEWGFLLLTCWDLVRISGMLDSAAARITASSIFFRWSQAGGYTVVENTTRRLDIPLFKHAYWSFLSTSAGAMLILVSPSHTNIDSDNQHCCSSQQCQAKVLNKTEGWIQCTRPPMMRLQQMIAVNKLFVCWEWHKRYEASNRWESARRARLILIPP